MQIQGIVIVSKTSHAPGNQHNHMVNTVDEHFNIYETTYKMA